MRLIIEDHMGNGRSNEHRVELQADQVRVELFVDVEP